MSPLVMAPATSLVLAAALALPVQGQPTQPGILALLAAGQEAELQEQILRRPEDIREAVAELFRLTARAAHSEDRVLRLVQAERLAGLYARVWADSFFVRRVQQFGRWSRDERAEKLEADSLRLAGNAAYRAEGPEAAITLWERSLTKHRALRDLAGQASVLGNLGAGYYALGQLERALRYHTRALELADGAGDHRTRGNALGNIASIHRARGDLALAAEFYGRALEVRALTGDRRGQASDLNNLALVRADLGDLRGAEQQMRRALSMNRRDGRHGPAANNLTNLANMVTLRGEYDSALDLYTEALDLRRRVGDRQGEALDLENLGLLHTRWGDYPAALRALDSALAILVQIGPPHRRGEVRSDIAAVQAAMGDLRAAVTALDSAEIEAGHDDYLAPLLQLRRADLLADLNEDQEAAERYERAEAGFAQLDDRRGRAEAEQGLGHLYMSRGDYDAAEEAFNRALRIQEMLDDPRPHALTQVSLGHVLRLQGDTAGARSMYERALTAHIGLGDRLAEAMTLGALADLDRDGGDLDAAVTVYRTALNRLEGDVVQPISWRLRFGLGLTLRAQGALGSAVSELGASVAQLERVGASFSTDVRRYGYLADKWSVYAELARTELERGHPARAFEASERMRARQLLDLLARGRTGSGTGSPALLREEQTLRRRIGMLTAGTPGALGNPSGPRAMSGDGSAADGTREALLTARAAYERLLTKVRETRPEYAAMVGGAPVAAGEVARLLPADAVLIEYLVSDDWTLVFVVSSTRTAALELPVGRERLRQLIAFFRGTVGSPSDDIRGDLWRTPLRSLYHELVEPLKDAGHLDGKRLLVIAPHAELHYLPFAALLESDAGNERFLVESFNIAYVPSASVWAQLAARDRSTTARGLLAMAPLPNVLEYSAGEVRTIGHDDSQAEVVIGPAATEGRLTALAADRRILHLATAGVLNRRNPLFSYVRLNPSPGTDGRLEVHEVFDLRLSADLVVLSACETGLGTGTRQDVPPGDDWVGLVRAFLFAGARSVIASLWPVEDQATAQFMKQLYAGLRGGASNAHALGNAQRAFIRDRDRSSPFYWAAFGLTGSVLMTGLGASSAGRL